MKRGGKSHVAGNSHIVARRGGKSHILYFIMFSYECYCNSASFSLFCGWGGGGGGHVLTITIMLTFGYNLHSM